MSVAIVVVCAVSLLSQGAVGQGEPVERKGQPMAAEPGRVLVPFTLTKAAPVFQQQFTPRRDGPHTVAANWPGAVGLGLSVATPGAQPASAAGKAPLQVGFVGQKSRPVTISISIEPAKANKPVKGELAVLLGKGNELSKRPLNAVEPMSPKMSAPRPGRKDVLTPIVMQLAERHLTGARDKNELDIGFEQAIAQAGLQRAQLQKVVASYKAIPAAVKRQRFITPTPGKGGLGPITRDDAMNALAALGPKAAQEMKQLRELRDKGPVTVFPRIKSLAPSSGVSAGQTLTINGEGFSKSPSDNAIEVWPSAPAAKAPSFTLRPQQGSENSLSVKLPANIAVDLWRLNVNVSRVGPSNQVSLDMRTATRGGGKAAGLSFTDVTFSGTGKSRIAHVKGANFSPDTATAVRVTSRSPYGVTAIEVPADVVSESLLTFPWPDDMLGPGKAALLAIGDRRVLNPEYLLGPVRYKIELDKMECVDECNPEYLGDDELVTFWVVQADDQCWAGNSREYGHFHDGASRYYSPADKYILGPEGQWCIAETGIAFYVKLYEWDYGDVDTARKCVKVVGTVASKIVGLINPVAGYIVSAVFTALEYALEYFPDWFGGAPECLGEQTWSWTGQHLRGGFFDYPEEGSKTKDCVNSFFNSGSLGDYRIWFKIKRNRVE